MSRPRRASILWFAALVALGGATVGCSSQPATPARQRFLAKLQEPGAHRFDQVNVGDGSNPLDAAQAACVATAFEKNKWPFESALEGKIPAKLDVKVLNQDVRACLQDPGTTTIGPFG